MQKLYLHCSKGLEPLDDLTQVLFKHGELFITPLPDGSHAIVGTPIGWHVRGYIEQTLAEQGVTVLPHPHNPEELSADHKARFKCFNLPDKPLARHLYEELHRHSLLAMFHPDT